MIIIASTKERSKLQGIRIKNVSSFPELAWPRWYINTTMVLSLLIYQSRAWGWCFPKQATLLTLRYCASSSHYNFLVDKNFPYSLCARHTVGLARKEVMVVGQEIEAPPPPPLSETSSSFPPSRFLRHVRVSEEDAPLTVLEAIHRALWNEMSSSSSLSICDVVVDHDNGVNRIPRDPDISLSASQLLHIGAVHFLPAGASLDRSLGVRAMRLTSKNATQLLQAGDYLRIHHIPRRFPAVYDYDWGSFVVTDGPTTPNNDTGIYNHNGPSTETTNHNKPGVLVAVDEEKGYIVIDKPAAVPVHATVDNVVENVPHFIRQVIKQREKSRGEIITSSSGDDDGEYDSHIYAASPQRLDQNTSGLMVVATKKVFAAYFAKLLRDQTDAQLTQQESHHENQNQKNVRKKYRCLVCLIPPPPKPQQLPNGYGSNHYQPTNATNDYDDDNDDDEPWSVDKAKRQLEYYVESQSILRHYLEPSIRAPKRFSRIRGNESWAECLLRIVSVGHVFQLCRSNDMTETRGVHQDLGLELWGGDPNRIPPDCAAVVELEIELLTGRTHQIRGQLSTEGFPLVGDAQYGGSIPNLAGFSAHVSPATHFIASERLALQCCELEFLDPDIMISSSVDENSKHETKNIRKQSQPRQEEEENAVPSHRWNTFWLDKAWWTPIISKYQVLSNQHVAQQESRTIHQKHLTQQQQGVARGNAELLPPRLQLAVGKHKYVLVKAYRPNDTNVLKENENNSNASIYWFVKSASVEDCRRPYHADVARDLVEWIEAAGFKAVITGGGRIDYDDTNDSSHPTSSSSSPSSPRAHVYGFSYAFGKGDHAKVAAIIREESHNRIQASYDNSNNLY